MRNSEGRQRCAKLRQPRIVCTTALAIPDPPRLPWPHPSPSVPPCPHTPSPHARRSPLAPLPRTPQQLLTGEGGRDERRPDRPRRDRVDADAPLHRQVGQGARHSHLHAGLSLAWGGAASGRRTSGKGVWRAGVPGFESNSTPALDGLSDRVSATSGLPMCFERAVGVNANAQPHPWPRHQAAPTALLPMQLRGVATPHLHTPADPQPHTSAPLVAE